MMGFQIVILWSDILIWLLVAAGIGVGVLIARIRPCSRRGAGSAPTGSAWPRPPCCSPSS
jgi:peptide/nickel transport system permease protein